MSKRISFASMMLAIWALVLAVCLLLTPAALAHHKPGHDQGGGSKAKSSQSEPDDMDDNQHPSGKDRETNNGPADDEQGKSKSNPDNDGRGPERNSCPGSGEGECVDKPGGDGGVDRDDQDGNNGCGNDDDFEDDNEGWCGRPHDKQKKVKSKRTCESSEDMPPGQVKKVCVKSSSMSAKEKKKRNSIKDEVLADVISKGNGGGGGSRGGRPDQVLAATITSSGAAPEVAGAALSAGEGEALGGILPFTGARIVTLLIAALFLVAGGLRLMRARGGRAT